MSQIPSALDELLWMIAENGDDSAIETFLKRYPDQRIELLRRRRMVMDLKGARPAALPPTRRPEFIPQTAPATAQAWRWPGVAASLVGLTLIAYAAYSVTERWQLSQLPPPSASVATPLEPPTTVPPVAFAPTSPPASPPVSAAPPPVETPPVPPPTPTDGTQSVATLNAKYERPISVRFTEVTLSRALELVGRASGLTVIIAPGIPDEVTEIDYVNRLPLDVLKDLGLRYRFTVFDQGDGSVLVIPAVDPNAVPSAPSPAARPVDTAPSRSTLQGPIINRN